MSLSLWLAAASLLVLGLGAVRPHVRQRAGGRGSLLKVLIGVPIPTLIVNAAAVLPIRSGVREALAVVGLSRHELATARSACGGVTAGLALVLMPVAPLIGLTLLPGIVVAPFAADLLATRDARRHGQAVVRQLPDALDLLGAATGAGMALDPALDLVAGRLGGAVGRELDVIRRDLEHGASRSRAYQGLRDRVPLPETDQLIGALLRADQLGSPLAETLARQADAMRHARAQRARDAAAKAGPKIQLVVALLMVPATLMLVIGLLLIELTRQVNAVIGAG